MVNQWQKPNVSSNEDSTSVVTVMYQAAIIFLGGLITENDWFIIENQTTRPCQNRQNTGKCGSSERSNLPKSRALCSAELGISQSTVQRILHKELAFQSHKIMTVQQLNPRDYQQRLSFCQTMLDMFEENEDSTLIMSDEAHFHLNGTVNKQGELKTAIRKNIQKIGEETLVK